MRFLAAAACTWLLALATCLSQDVEQWGVYEAAVKGPDGGNPFADVEFAATFSHGETKLKASGFYDGEGMFRVRCMPDAVGEWTYTTHSNRPELDGKSGKFKVVPPAAGNHGPVKVSGEFHFAYADGTPYLPFGTTCYAWTHQAIATEEATLKTLEKSPFNKIRMCVFPKRYAFNQNEPLLYPFEGTPPNRWDYTRFNPAFFKHLEGRIEQLRELGIEADVILFHPYDGGHWGFDRMPSETDDRYLKYVVARLAAYRNVWWSLANEFDFMKEKRDSDWTRFIEIVAAADPYRRLCSIHNGTRLFNHNHPLLTHASIQNGSAVAEFGRAVLYRDAYRKPIVFDESKYEGNFEQRWGNLSAEEMVHRFWLGAIGGTYTGHGETYHRPDDVVWWAKGGVLHGQSPPRIAFLRKVLEEGPRGGIDPIDKWQEDYSAGRRGEYYLVYLGKSQPAEWNVELPLAKLEKTPTLTAEVLDVWNMTVTPVPGKFVMRATSTYRMAADPPAKISLPGKPFQAIRLRAVTPEK